MGIWNRFHSASETGPVNFVILLYYTQNILQIKTISFTKCTCVCHVNVMIYTAVVLCSIASVLGGRGWAGVEWWVEAGSGQDLFDCRCFM